MMYEECESEVANLLASINNLPRNSFDKKIEILCVILELQQKQIEGLQKVIDSLPELYELKEKMLTPEEVEEE